MKHFLKTLFTDKSYWSWQIPFGIFYTIVYCLICLHYPSMFHPWAFVFGYMFAAPITYYFFEYPRHKDK